MTLSPEIFLALGLGALIALGIAGRALIPAEDPAAADATVSATAVLSLPAAAPAGPADCAGPVLPEGDRHD